MNSTALITGVSRRSGNEFVRRFASEGHSLVIVGPQRAELEGVASECRREFGVDVRVIESSLADDREAKEVYRKAAEGAPVEVLVNQLPDDADQVGEGKRSRAEAVIRLTRLIALPMIIRGRGRILNAAAGMGTERKSVAAAASAFVLSLSRAFATELLDSGVTVSALCGAQNALACDRN